MSNNTQALPECEIISKREQDIPILKHNLFNHYYYNLTNLSIPSQFKVQRTYEGCQNYLIVFAPLANHIDKTSDLKSIEKYLRDKYQYKRIIITRESLASRVHYNVVLTTTKNPITTNGTIVQKFYLNVQHVPNQDDLNKVIRYIFKESEQKPFYPNRDYFIFIKN